jgi:hypothetical protein
MATQKIEFDLEYKGEPCKGTWYPSGSLIIRGAVDGKVRRRGNPEKIETSGKAASAQAVRELLDYIGGDANNPLDKQLAVSVVQQKAGWFSAWKQLAERYASSAETYKFVTDEIVEYFEGDLKGQWLRIGTPDPQYFAGWVLWNAHEQGYENTPKILQRIYDYHVNPNKQTWDRYLSLVEEMFDAEHREKGGFTKIGSQDN